MSTIEVKVPDIGDFADVPVIEVLVKPGDAVKAEDSLVTLESDKATMDVPSPSDGVVKELRVKVGDKVSQGTSIVVLEGNGAAGDARPSTPAPAPARTPAAAPPAQANATAQAERSPRGEKGLADAPAEGPTSTPPSGSTVEVKVPDIGDFSDVPVIEIFVKPGDIVSVDDPLMTLESDKATMDVPSPIAGAIEGVRVSVGDRVSEGTVIVSIAPSVGAMPSPQPSPASGRGSSGSQPSAASGSGSSGSQPSVAGGSGHSETQASPQASAASGRGSSEPQPSAASARGSSEAQRSPQPSPASGRGSSEARPSREPGSATGRASAEPSPRPLAGEGPGVRDEQAFRIAHASPSVRKFARELGVDLSKLSGSGPNGRILHEDVQRYVKQALTAAPPAAAAPAAGAGSGGLNLLPWPKVDFAKFGPVESKPLSRIKKISGANLARNWVMIPHVTQHEHADITELEALRVQLNKEHEKAGVKFTMLAFLIKASVAALRRFPDFNASLDGDNLVYKQYYNIGFAADTPNGLVVPVVKGADQKGLVAIAKEMAELSAKARDGKLGPADMQGGCFSISSLGGIGGTAFTPIVNAPEVAILGVSKSAMQPVWDGKAFAPRLMLPMSLSYDHRVIDGASAARFTTYLAQILADFRRVIL